MVAKPSEERIKLNMRLPQVIAALSEGVIGTVRVLSDVAIHAEAIDPNNIPYGMGFMLMCDTYRIYGSDIWMLYKDACKEDLGKMMLVVRATQLGFITPTQLKASYGGRYDKKRDSETGELIVTEQYQFDVVDLLAKVQDITPFDMEARSL